MTTVRTRTSRRGVLGLAAAIAPGLLLPRGAAWVRQPTPASYRLVPDWSEDWALHRTRPDVAGVIQLPAGIQAFTGDYHTVDQGFALWARTPLTGDFKAMFHYTRTDTHTEDGTQTTPNGIYTQFYWSVVGEGSAAWPEDVSAWDAYTAAEPVTDATYVAHARGLRVSFNTYNTTGAAQSDRVRLRFFPGTPSNKLGIINAVESPPPLFPFPSGEEREITLTRQGTFFGFASEAPDGTVTRTTFASPVIAQDQGGWLGFRVAPGRQCRIENLVIVPG
jgi:hypothetical protein